MSFRSSVDGAPARCSGGHGFDLLRELRFFLCPALVLCWSIHLSHFINEVKIHHLYSLITTHDDFNGADPGGMQDACHIWTQLNDLVLHEFSQLISAQSACAVFGRSWILFLSGTYLFPLSHACVMLINSPFTIIFLVTKYLKFR